MHNWRFDREHHSGRPPGWFDGNNIGVDDEMVLLRGNGVRRG